jgi:Ca-activated chloride channel family protein
MIDWGEPRLLILGAAALALLAVLVGRALRRRRWALGELVGPRLGPRLSATSSETGGRIRYALMWFGLVALVLAAAGPRWGREVVRVSGQGSDLVLVFDTSISMDARDVPPSRLEEAKREAGVLLDGLQGDRVALVVFAGDATVLSPLTLDYSAIRLLIRSLTSGMLSRPGTDLGKGIRTALDLLEGGTPSEQAIIVFTDGEDLERGATGVTTLAGRKGVRLFTVGVGTPGGQAIPLRDQAGREIGVKQKPEGGVLVSRLDERLLREMARKTGGAYFSAQHPGGESGRLRRAVSRVERGTREGRLGSRPVERFALFAWIAWIAWVAAWLWPRRKPVTALSAARDSSPITALAVTLGLLGAPGTLWAGPLEKGNEDYRNGRYQTAAETYRKGLEKKAEDWRLLANLGNALYQLEDYPASEAAYAQALAAGGGELSPETEAHVTYNRGNSLFRQSRYAEAAADYRASLEKMPDDPDARFNFEAAMARLRNPPEPPPESGGGGGGAGSGGGGGSDQQQPQPRPTPPSPSPKPVPDRPQDPQASSGQLSRAEAERLLDALAEEEARAQKEKGRARITTERRERDW